MRMDWAGWLTSGLRGLVLLLALLLSAELVIRLDDWMTWQAPLTGPYTNERLLSQDSLGYRGRANFRYQKWRMNNAGFRGPDLAPEPAPGVERIALLGASETFGLYESEGAEYPARMQQLLDSLAPGRYQVINAALPGMSLSSAIGYFRRAVLPYKPRLLLFYPSPSFYLEVNPLPVDYRPPRLRVPPPVRVGPWTVPGDFFDSRLKGKAREVLKELIPTFLVTAVREWSLARQRSAHPPQWVWRTPPAERLDIMRQHLEQLVAAVQPTGVRLVLVTHTNRFIGAAQDTLGPDRKHLINVMSVYWPQATPGVLVSLDSVANDIIRQVAAEHGVAVAELQGQVPPTPRYFADYVHFTDQGADSVARILTGEVLRLAPDTGSTPPPGGAPR